MELVNKLSFKNIISLKSISDKNIKLEKILKKNLNLKIFIVTIKKF